MRICQRWHGDIFPIDMKHLFFPEGDNALAATMANRPLLAFDFDGTLAPIVARPDDARLSLAVARRLSRLSEVLPVAIVTGRSVDDVRSRLEFEPRFIIGNHGAEDPDAQTGAESNPALAGIRERLAEQAQALAMAGVSIEDKLCSIALHYRLARDRQQALHLINELLGTSDPAITVYGGKLVVNVVASDAPDKAQAVASLVQRCGAHSVLYMGDDMNDEPVFARNEPTWLTIRIGRDYPNSQARYFLDNSGEVATMLDRMLTMVGDDQL